MFTRTILIVSAAIFFMNSGVASAAGDSAVYVYDAYNRLQTVTYANGTVIKYTYDSAGNRQTVVTTCTSNPC